MDMCTFPVGALRYCSDEGFLKSEAIANDYLMFNVMITNSCMTTIRPLLNNKNDDMAVINNHRVIALYNTICKLFEGAVPECFQTGDTHDDSHQCRFKAKKLPYLGVLSSQK